MVKERCRATRHGLPFQKFLKLLTTHIILNMVKMIKFFLTKGIISDSLIRNTIMSGKTLDFKKNLYLQLGQYCKVKEEDIPLNSQAPRTKGEICLGPSGNLQGKYKFMALNSGKKIIRKNWDLIPMT